MPWVKRVVARRGRRLGGGLVAAAGAVALVGALLPRYAGQRLAYLRWRSETFGLYDPAYLHERAWWHVNPRAAWRLASLLPAYLRWVRAMELLRRGGPEAAWSAQLGEHAEAWTAARQRLEDED